MKGGAFTREMGIKLLILCIFVKSVYRMERVVEGGDCAMY